VFINAQHTIKRTATLVEAPWYRNEERSVVAVVFAYWGLLLFK